MYSSSTAARVGERNSARWPTYLSLDLRASWRRVLPSGALTTWLEITNATDQRNPCCFSLQESASPMGRADIDTWAPRLFNPGVEWSLR